MTPAPPLIPTGRHRAQRGLSLPEVIIYAALSLLLVGLAMGALGTAQKGMSQNGETARMRSDAEEAVQVMGRDLRNLGLKRLLFQDGAGTVVDTFIPAATFLPGDSSSFRHRDGNQFDSLTFLRAGLDMDGKPIRVDTVSYGVDPSTRSLMRAVNGASREAICTRVEALQFEYGLSARRTDLAGESPPVAAHWRAAPANRLSISGNSLVVFSSGAATVSFFHASRAFATSAARRYAFDITGLGDPDLMANLVSLDAVLYRPDGSIVAAEPFRVGTAFADYHIETGGADCGDCRAGVRVVLKERGKLKLSRFSFSEVSQGDIVWSPAPILEERKAARAVRIYLLVGSGKDLHGLHANTMRLANADLKFSDGRGRSLLDEIVPTPNNGP